MIDEPERLLDGGGSDLERILLRAASDEEPSSRSMRRTAVALAAATGTSTFTKSLWAAKEFVQPLTTHAGKMVAGSVLVGSTAFVAAQVGAPSRSELPPALDSRPPAAEKGAVTEEVDDVTTDVEVIPHLDDLPAIDEPEEEPNTRKSTTRRLETVAPVPSPEQEKVKRGTIADEIAALDRARRSLDSGNAGKALVQLDTYSKLFPSGRLGQEAMVMRIRALVHAGRGAEAESMARRFRSANPQSPYNKRIDSIVAVKDGR